MAHLHVIYARTCTHEAYFRLLCEVILHGDKGIGLSLFSTDLSAFCMLPFPWPGLPITSVNIQSWHVMLFETPQRRSLSLESSGPLQWGCRVEDSLHLVCPSWVETEPLWG